MFKVSQTALVKEKCEFLFYKLERNCFSNFNIPKLKFSVFSKSICVEKYANLRIQVKNLTS